MPRSSHKVAALPVPDIQFTVEVWQEGRTFVAYAPELDVSSCGKSLRDSREHLREAVTLFLEQAARTGSLHEILSESGFQKRGGKYRPPRRLAREQMELQVPVSA